MNNYLYLLQSSQKMMPDKKQCYICILIIIALQLLLTFQGFDVCDEGFSLTFYQQIFNSPNSVEYNFSYWLSGIVGGLWYKLFEGGGILWFRFLAVLVNTSTFMLSYKLLANYMRSRDALIGLSMVLFVNNYGHIVFYHNHLSALLAVLSICFLYYGLTKQKSLFVVLSGMVIGVNVFTRIPNITLLILVVAIPVFIYWKSIKLVKSVRLISFFSSGFLLGLLLVFGLMFFLGHLSIMEKSLLSIIDLGKNEGSTHNIFYLLHSYVSNYKKIFLLFCAFVVTSIGFLYKKSVFKTNKFLYVFKGFLCFFIFTILFQKGGIYIVYALGYAGVLSFLAFNSSNNYFKLLSLLGFLMMFILPLGSSGGVYDSGYMWIWLSVPIFIHLLSSFNDLQISLKYNGIITSISTSKKAIKSLMLVVFFSYFSAKAYSISQEAYFDKGSRFYKTYKINSPLARGVYTTEKRAEVINEFLPVLERFVAKDDYLFVYDNMPMLHFITQTRPYMYNPWVWVYDATSFKNKLLKAEKEIPVLPIIVQQRFNTLGEFSNPITGYLRESGADSYLFNRQRIAEMNSFIKRNNYKVVWSNSYFNIYSVAKN